MDREEASFSSDGQRCAAWVFRPDGGGPPSPCVVMGSGLSCLRDQGMDRFAERFAAAGISAVAFDYRHWGASEGEPRSLLDVRAQQRDWRAALAFARALGGVDGRRIAVWGFSLGGGHAQVMAATEPGIAAAVLLAPLQNGVRTLLHAGGAGHLLRVSIAGVRDTVRGLRGAPPYLIPVAGPPGSLAVLSSYDALPGYEAVTPVGSSWRNETLARTALRAPYRPGRVVRRIRCPTMFCINTEDGVNPPQLGIRAARRSPSGTLSTYPGGHFDGFLGQNFEAMAADQTAFLSQHLRPA
jgi:pimeloyl-ACP methyl ester carboxylesterase